MKKEHKKEGILKRLKNIEDKNKEQLKAIKGQKEEKEELNRPKNPLIYDINTIFTNTEWVNFLIISLVYWIMHQSFMIIWLKSTKKSTRESTW